MNRRNFLVQGASTVAVSSMIGATLALADKKKEKKTTTRPRSGLNAEALKKVAVTSLDCEKTGEACVTMCMDMGSDMPEFAECLRTVRDMLATVHAMHTLAHADSPSAKAQAAVCAETCRVCKEACAEHKKHFEHGMHLECKACMEACEACEKACKALA